MARPVLCVKGEKWPCAIKMKLEKVLALSLVFSFFFPVKLRLSITHSDPLLSISCPGSLLSLPTHPKHGDLMHWPRVWRAGSFYTENPGPDRVTHETSRAGWCSGKRRRTKYEDMKWQNCELKTFSVIPNKVKGPRTAHTIKSQHHTVSLTHRRRKQLW